MPRKQNIWVFGAWFGERYSDNPKVLFEYMLKEHPEYTCIWITKNETLFRELRSKNIPSALADSKEGKKFCRKAKLAICGSGINDFNPLYTNGIKEIWLWHGMPLKKIGWDDKINQSAAPGNFVSKLLYPWDRFSPDYTITSSKFFLPFLQSAFHLTENHIFETGLPRCDNLFGSERERIIVELREKHPGCKIILYMPTFRTSPYTGIPFDPFASFNFDKAKFHKTLEEKNYVFLYKPHFCDEACQNNITAGNFYVVGDSDYNDLYCLIKDIDILMTDYSSVYFDFITTKKPVILSPFDYENYITESRSHYYDYFEYIEGVKAKNWNEVCAILSAASFYPVSDETINKYAGYNDGHSAEKLFHTIEANLIKRR
jgi:CDP-glycerol glycerophosphotransferase